MECLLTAKFTVAFSESFVFGSETFSIRVSPAGLSISIDLNKKITIQGFRNIDAYGIKFVPRFSMTDSNYYSAGEASTFVYQNQYDFDVDIEGQGIDFLGTTTLPANVTQSNSSYILDNYVSEITFTSPIKSLKSIDLNLFQANFPLTYANSLAIAGHNLTLSIRGDFYLYYRFQED
jgi:hypothetical protein